jgi:quinol monooxygenase YgiN
MIVTAVFTPKHGEETALHSLLHSQAQHSWPEPGVISYTINEILGKPRTFMNVEVYESLEAFQLHEEMDYTKLFMKEMFELVEVPPLVHIGSTLFSSEHPKASF